tara:strand:- start:581 stop:757 length:177 start_codon:yes stop_codon:yes gene_type:complete
MNKKKDYIIQMVTQDDGIIQITKPHTHRVTKTSLIRLKRVLPDLQMVKVERRKKRKNN